MKKNTSKLSAAERQARSRSLARKAGIRTFQLRATVEEQRAILEYARATFGHDLTLTGRRQARPAPARPAGAQPEPKVKTPAAKRSNKTPVGTASAQVAAQLELILEGDDHAK